MKSKSKNNLPIKDAFNFGWEKFKDNIVLFLTIVAVIWVVFLAPTMISEEISESFPMTSMIISIIGFVISLIVSIGLIKISLNFTDKKKSTISDLFSSQELFFIYLGGAILYTLIMAGGLILLIIPGIVWWVKYQFYGFAIVDKNMGPVEALKESGKITKGKKGQLLLFNIIAGIINLVGILFFTLGLFITIPITALALAFIYRHLSPSTAKRKTKRKKIA
ncbi:MAG: hypothetical protein WD471_00580 [Candidatus Paceibacterota bacterium]